MRYYCCLPTIGGDVYERDMIEYFVLVALCLGHVAEQALVVIISQYAGFYEDVMYGLFPVAVVALVLVCPIVLDADLSHAERVAEALTGEDAAPLIRLVRYLLLCCRFPLRYLRWLVDEGPDIPDQLHYEPERTCSSDGVLILCLEILPDL